ncbi:divergent polysaccharide deacetylase family protein [Sulfurimonas sp.]|uniref:divergent polysaccharide deacetylase family protein n=1 Tax=Sulfurimonas sp. TaxID=2022749 RepID=UPI0025E9BCAB|nr:divergent polysaccharide deacetylase family protein [Sulfurimonas sp.]
MAKRRSRSSGKNSNSLKYIVIALIFIATVLFSLLGGYYFGYSEAKDDMAQKEKVRLEMLEKLENASIGKDKTTDELLKKNEPTVEQEIEKKVEKDVNESVKIAPKAELEKEPKKQELKAEIKTALKTIDSSHEYDPSTLPQPPKRGVRASSEKPKLAIIIDDVSIKSHVSAVHGLNLPITMSFLPPSENGPKSNILAQNEKFYMVHLPMEAQNFTKEEPFTLRVSDSQSEISQRVRAIKELFPRVHYINNHTGSKFTSDEASVNRLIYALDKENINFIDSRTVASTKIQKVMESYGKKYVGRDIFLDHQADKGYVKSQIKKAVEMAKLHGNAIAIGHPHENTILAISESKELLKSVELVFVDKIY